MSKALIITGMHRSGTSLIGSLMQSAGVHIGDKLLAGNSANPRGYFEDVDFYEFQEQLLRDRGQTYLYVNSPFEFEPTTAEIDRARQLIEERSQQPSWGWKDPRTSLFLSFWHQLLPDARFLFVYRHPLEVLLSLLRRGEFDTNLSPMAGLQAWQVYNAKILALCDEHPNRCLVVHIDGVIKNPTAFSDLIRNKLQIDSAPGPEEFARIYQGNELQKTPFSKNIRVVLPKIFPGLLEMYQHLNRVADLPSDQCEVDSADSHQFAPLVQLTEDLPKPISLSIKHSLLQILLSSLSPELTERMLARFQESAKSCQQKADYLWMLVQQYQRLHADNKQELDRRWSQITEQQSELDRRRAQISALSAELKSIYRTPVGKAIRSYRNLKEKWRGAA
jgi:hypothetical protein